MQCSISLTKEQIRDFVVSSVGAQGHTLNKQQIMVTAKVLDGTEEPIEELIVSFDIKPFIPI